MNEKVTYVRPGEHRIVVGCTMYFGSTLLWSQFRTTGRLVGAPQRGADNGFVFETVQTIALEDGETATYMEWWSYREGEEATTTVASLALWREQRRNQLAAYFARLRAKYAAAARVRQRAERIAAALCRAIATNYRRRAVALATVWQREIVWGLDLGAADLHSCAPLVGLAITPELLPPGCGAAVQRWAPPHLIAPPWEMQRVAQYLRTAGARHFLFGQVQRPTLTSTE